jgi:manganese transport protein
LFLWVLAEIAMISTDLAEVIGSGIALQLLFGIPLVVGCLITGFDVLVILFLQSKPQRFIKSGCKKAQEQIFNGWIGIEG